MVLCHSQRIDLLARHYTHKRELGAGQEILDHHSTLAKACIQEHVAQSLLGLVVALGHHHSFACCQTVVLDNCGQRAIFHILPSGLELVESLISSRGNSVFGHQPLGKLLATLNLSSLFGGAKGFQPTLLEAVYDTNGQGSLGTNDGHIDLLLFGKSHQSLHIGNTNGHTLGLLGNTGISGGAVNLLHLWRTAQCIHNGVTPTAATHNKYSSVFHKVMSLFYFLFVY